MRGTWRISVLIGVAVLALSTTARADLNAGISISDGGIKSFYLAVGDFYEVPQERVVFVKGKSIPDDEVPVVFFLATQAGVGPEAIIKMRLGGKSWMEISLHYGITAEAYYVPVSRPPGPPYGKAWGHFKNKKKADWGSIRLADDDIVNFVNLKFISGHYGCSADEVIKQRGSGKGYAGISQEFEKKRTVSNASPANGTKSGATKNKGKGKNKSR